MADFAQPEDVATAWRPLSSQQQDSAKYYIGVVERRIRRRWPDVDARLAAGTLTADDLRDVVVQLVIPVLAALEAPTGARSFQVSSGGESRQVTLDAGARVELPDFDDWMVAILDAAPSAAPLPVGAFPRSGRYDCLFEWKEGRP